MASTSVAHDATASGVASSRHGAQVPRRSGTAWSGVITFVTVGALLLGAIGVVHLFDHGAAYYPAGASSGTQPRSGYDLRRGQAVLVEWNGTWYPATVVGAVDSSGVTIHYDGFSASYDERGSSSATTR